MPIDRFGRAPARLYLGMGGLMTRLTTAVYDSPLGGTMAKATTTTVRGFSPTRFENMT